ncbi:CapA family protein [Niallia oryzisoli]|uniref:CapA family protein n=1 Tax=Niallia oryzisoli TaxID=1737571 RepID=UPI003735B655
MSKKPITVLGVGDVIIDREEPETIFQHVAEVMRSGDITFANCDQTYSDIGYAIRGSATYSASRNIPALLYGGFDVLSLANNHTVDWGRENLIDTMEKLDEVNLPYCGVGRNIEEARKPVIIDREGTKVGFLAYSCVHPKGFEADAKKSGLAPVRIWTIYDQIDYQPGTPPRIVSMAYKEDLEAMVKDIKKLKQEVDVVVVSYHWGQHMIPRVIPMYCHEVGHAAIDAGADLILGTHTHIAKGIEMYKGKAIFYSTGNFAAEIGPGTADGPGGPPTGLLERYNVTADPEMPKGYVSREARNTMIAKAYIEDGEIKKVTYIPCYINNNCEPEIVVNDDSLGQGVFNYIEDISNSENLNVKFSWDGDEVLIESKE